MTPPDPAKHLTLRLAADLIHEVDALGAEAGWTRTQTVSALLRISLRSVDELSRRVKRSHEDLLLALIAPKSTKD